MARQTLILFMLAVALCGCTGVPENVLGPWRTDTDEIVSIRQSGDDALRLRFYETGETRRFTHEGDRWIAATGVVPDRLEDARLRFSGSGFELESATGFIRGEKIDLPVRHAEVDAGDIKLHTRLMLPRGDGPFPVIVIAHGSGDDAATRTYAHGDFFSANGIASVVYDKRGTGRSGGEYGHDFQLLADDLVSVVQWVKAQPGIDRSLIGVSGYSQGGWIGPLAASKSKDISFVLVNYGMIDSPRDEEVIETVNTIAKRGFEGEALQQARALSTLTVDIMASNYQHGWVDFNRLVQKYENEPWMAHVEGTTVGEFLAWPQWVVRLAGPLMSPAGLDWDYNSLDALDRMADRNVPSAWLIAGQDSSAPNEFTLSELARRQAKGEPVIVKVFENTDHGIVTFVETDGVRRYGNYHSDYFRAQVAVARQMMTRLESDNESASRR